MKSRRLFSRRLFAAASLTALATITSYCSGSPSGETSLADSGALGLDGGTSGLDGGTSGLDGDTSTADASGTDTGSTNGPLMILTQPANLTVTDGQPASFSVTASGDQPLKYQWQHGSTLMLGASAATLSIPATIYKYHNGATYSVVVSDAAGAQRTSQAATLTIIPRPPVITEAPLSQTVVPNSTATFAVAATGSIPLTYAWSLNGMPISGASAPSYTTGANTYAQNNQDSYTVIVTNGANQTTTSAAAVLTVGMPALPPTITVECSENDAVVAHQVAYRRGVVEQFDLDRAPSAIVADVTTDIQTSGINFINAALDINGSPDAPFFTYVTPSLTSSPSGSAPLLQTFAMLSGAAPSGTLQTVVQVSGTPAVYASNLDTSYAAACGCSSCNGNFYPLPTPGTSMQVAQNAVESWIGDLNSSFPGAIWIGTQEPSHTLGYSMSYDESDAACSEPPAADKDVVMSDNIQRFLTYWTPIAKYLRTNHILSGGVQLNSGNSIFFAQTATKIVSAQMPLDYFTVQDYSPAPAVDQALYAAYQEFQQNPDYLGVKIILDRYGISLTESSDNTYGTAAGVIDFLGDEAQLMPYADMMYGYGVETIGIQNATSPTMLAGAVKWLQAAPAPLRPLTSTTSDLQAFALVQKASPQRAYVAIWNVSTSAAYTTSVVLNDLGASFTASNLTVLKGSQANLTTLNNSGITVSGDTMSGLSLNANEFLLISVE